MAHQQPHIDEVRETVRERLSQLSRGTGDFRETYLMSDSMFSGVRFEQGPFHAVWKLGEMQISVCRDTQQIVMIEMGGAGSANRAA